MFRASFRTAFGALRRNRLRTLLTTLSISIGIAAVICVVALGAGSTAQVTQQIDNLGEDFLWIEPGSFNAGGVRSGWGGRRSLRVEDAFAIEATAPDVEACSPITEGREQLVAATQNWNTRYQGVAPSFFHIRRWTVQAGALFNEVDVEQANKVVVLGQVVAERLFGEEVGQTDPIGQTIRLGRAPFIVVAVLQSKGASRAYVDRDDGVFVPYTTAMQSLNRRTWIDDIMCSVPDHDNMDRAEFMTSQVLRVNHGMIDEAEDDFAIRKPTESLEMRAATMRTMTMMLMAIASVSLVVGGVGIMNIMLVSVTERTREIGLRLAVGAKMSDIRLQFLVEAAVLGVLGGAVGVAGGWLGSQFLQRQWGWPVLVSSEAAFVAVACAAGAALVFGYYPAHQASALDPIDALRTET
jgi:putative ABC transport system permease protein